MNDIFEKERAYQQAEAEREFREIAEIVFQVRRGRFAASRNGEIVAEFKTASEAIKEAAKHESAEVWYTARAIANRSRIFTEFII